MKERSIRLALATASFFIYLPAWAETVDVKYGGSVDLAPFECSNVRSSFVERICFDKVRSYMLINLKGTWYHYCSIPDATISSLLKAESVGRFFNAAVKGKFGCRQSGR